MKKFLLCTLMCFLLCGCTNLKNDKHNIAKIEWQDYDNLIKLADNENDAYKRSKLMHKAEEMIMDTGVVIPLYSSMSKYLLNTDIHNVYIDCSDTIHYSRIYKENSDGKTPLRINVTSEKDNLDPQKDLYIDVYNIWDAIGACLLSFDENNNIVPDLAKNYEVSDDGLIYKFYLKDNLTWSDGVKISADDFVYTWKRAAYSDNAMEGGDLITYIKGYPNDLHVYSEDDGKVFVVELQHPCVFFPSITCAKTFALLRQDVIENAPGFKDSAGKILNPSAWATGDLPVSCGPYILKQWKHNESMVLVKNPLYYDSESVKTETIEIMLNKDETISYSAYETGDICLLLNKIPSDITETLYGKPDFHTTKCLGTAYMAISTKSEIFNDMSSEDAKTFRKAIGYCIDRKFLTKIISVPEEYITTAIIPKAVQDGTETTFGETEGYTYPIEDGFYPVNPDYNKARDLLKSIGYEFDKNGKLKNSINLDYLTSSSETNEAIATCIQADLAQIGINVNIKTTETNVFYADRTSGQFDMARGLWSLDYADPISMLNIFTTNSSNNHTQLGR